MAQLIWALELGGAERQVASLAPALAKAGEEVTIFCFTRKGPLAQEVEQAGVKVKFVAKRARLDASFVVRLARAFRRHRIEVVHAHLFTSNLWGAIAARLSGASFIMTEHGPRVFSHPFQLAVTRVLARNADALQVVSEPLYERFTALRPRRLRFIPLGVDLNRIAGNPPWPDIPWPATSEPIGVSCRLAPEKDLATFVNAVALVRQRRERAIGVIVGEGPERRRLEERIRETGHAGAFYMLGYRRDAIPILKRMRVAVLTSIAEGMPVSLLEALAAGVPVVATANDGVRAIITDGVEGRLAPIGDAPALARQILAQLESPLPAEPGRHKVERHYALEPVIVERVRELYREVASVRCSSSAEQGQVRESPHAAYVSH